MSEATLEKWESAPGTRATEGYSDTRGERRRVQRRKAMAVPSMFLQFLQCNCCLVRTVKTVRTLCFFLLLLHFVVILLPVITLVPRCR